MRRMQDEADAGKIGGVLKRIMAKSSSFSLEVLYGQSGNTTDPLEIAKTVTEFFKAWFNSDQDDDERDSDVADFSASGNEEAWAGLADRLGVPLDHAREIMEGMSDKPLADEAKVEAKALDEYIPTLEDFNSYIKTLNPKSAGGPSGLTYLQRG